MSHCSLLCLCVQEFVEGEANEDEDETAVGGGMAMGTFGKEKSSMFQGTLDGGVLLDEEAEADMNKLTKEDLEHIVDELSDGTTAVLWARTRSGLHSNTHYMHVCLRTR